MSDQNPQPLLLDAPQVPAKARFTLRQGLFIDFFVGEANFNGAEAARLAKYSPRTARYMAYENLSKPHIAREIKRRLDLMGLSEDEVKGRLGQMARGEIPTKTVDKDGEVTKVFDERQALENVARIHGMFLDKSEHRLLPGLDIIDGE